MKAIVLGMLTVALLVFPTHVWGVILMGSGDPTYNTTPASDDKGWKYQGTMRNPGSGVYVLATVISKRHIISLKHINIMTNAEFVINGTTNYVSRVFADPNSELVICKMAATNAFGTSSNNHAPLYQDVSPIGKSCSIFGLGQQRGELVTSELVNSTPFIITNTSSTSTQFSFGVTGGDMWMKFVVEQSTNLTNWDMLPGTHYAPSVISIDTSTNSSQMFFRIKAITTITNGWRTGPLDLVKRWGENTIEGIDNEFLVTTFDQSSNNPNECTVTPYDSSGGLFVKDTDGIWKIAGLTDQSYYWPWSHDMGVNVFSAALFDHTGLWYFHFPYSYYIAPRGQQIPTEARHTAVAPRVSWIRSAMKQ